MQRGSKAEGAAEQEVALSINQEASGRYSSGQDWECRGSGGSHFSF